MGGRLAEEPSGVPSPEHQPKDEAAGPPPPSIPDPLRLEGREHALPGGSWGHLEQPHQLPIDSGQPPACQAQQQGPAGSGRVPSVCPRAGTTSRRRVLHLPPPRLPGADSAPWNKQSPTVTADTRHSPPGLPSDQWGLGSGSVVGSGVLPWKVLVLTNLD